MRRALPFLLKKFFPDWGIICLTIFSWSKIAICRKLIIRWGWSSWMNATWTILNPFYRALTCGVMKFILFLFTGPELFLIKYFVPSVPGLLKLLFGIMTYWILLETLLAMLFNFIWVQIFMFNLLMFRELFFDSVNLFTLIQLFYWLRRFFTQLRIGPF